MLMHYFPWGKTEQLGPSTSGSCELAVHTTKQLPTLYIVAKLDLAKHLITSAVAEHVPEIYLL
jgi:hypothetical protein